MIHELKILPEHFWPVYRNEKKAEVRKNDRGFNQGDYLKLMEFSPLNGFTGKIVVRRITHIADIGAYLEGFVLLGMEMLDE